MNHISAKYPELGKLKDENYIKIWTFYLGI